MKGGDEALAVPIDATGAPESSTRREQADPVSRAEALQQLRHRRPRASGPDLAQVNVVEDDDERPLRKRGRCEVGRHPAREPWLGGNVRRRRDRLESLDLLAHAVLFEHEVLGDEAPDRTALCVDDSDVDLDEVGARLEPGGDVVISGSGTRACEKRDEPSHCAASTIPRCHRLRTLRRSSTPVKRPPASLSGIDSTDDLYSLDKSYCRSYFAGMDYPPGTGTPVGAGTLDVISSPGRAAMMLDPLRLRLLEGLRLPDSAAGLARRLRLPRQRVNYHLRELEKQRLVELAGRRRRGNCTARILRATAPPMRSARRRSARR